MNDDDDDDAHCPEATLETRRDLHWLNLQWNMEVVTLCLSLRQQLRTMSQCLPVTKWYCRQCVWSVSTCHAWSDVALGAGHFCRYFLNPIYA